MRGSTFIILAIISAIPAFAYPVYDAAHIEARKPFKVRPETYVPPEARPAYVHESAFSGVRAREPMKLKPGTYILPESRPTYVKESAFSGLEARAPMKLVPGTYIPPDKRPSYVKESAFTGVYTKRKLYRVMFEGEAAQIPPARREPLVLLPGMQPIEMPRVNGRPIAVSLRDVD